jgi:8-amino-7-oxononanoate synthase
MTTSKFARHQKTLSRLRAKNRYRKLCTQTGIDFSSNDYLGFSKSRRIRQALHTALDNNIAIGSGGSRLLRGNHYLFEELENFAAQFFGSGKALYFSSGYLANFSVFATLPKRDDLILYDELVHASILDGIAQSAAHSIAIRHNNVNHFENTITEWRNSGGTGNIWIAVESLYSMDGDQSPLQELLSVIKKEDGVLIIDEAHATGVLGSKGRGLTHHLKSHENVITIHTCSKALGVAGGLVCCNQLFYEYLINRARPFIFTTAPSPLMAVAVFEALKMLDEEPEHQHKLNTLMDYANTKIKMINGMHNTKSQIIPIMLNHDERAVHIAEALQQKGFDVRAIRPPTVPIGTSRLRISITLNVDESDIDELVEELAILL